MKSMQNSNNSLQSKMQKQIMELQYLSAPVKTPESSSSDSPTEKVDTPKIAHVPTPLNLRSVGWYIDSEKPIGRAGFEREGAKICKNADGYNSFVFNISHNFAFSCCGAAEMNGFQGGFSDEKDIAHFLIAFLPFVKDVTLYGIYTDAQMQYAHSELSLLNLLFKIGAETVDARPNRVHGPAIMNMIVLDPVNLKWEEIHKYLTPCYNNYTGDFYIPNYVLAFPPEKQKALYDKWKKANKEEYKLDKERKEKYKQDRWLEPLRKCVYNGLLYYMNYNKKYGGAQINKEIIEEATEMLNKLGWELKK
jgi:hypothetical protein